MNFENLQLLKKSFLLCLLFCLSLVVKGQISELTQNSKHERDLEIYSKIAINKIESDNYTKIIPLNTFAKSSLSASVFGYLPYWEYPDAMNFLQYDLLTHIAVFDFQASVTGSLDFPPNWPWVDLINQSHENGVKIIATVVNFNSSQIHAILNNADVKEELFNNIQELISEFSLDGVNIDFEDINSSDRGVVLINFMNELSVFLHEINPDYEVSFATPPINWGGWDFEGLANSCDYLFIMGYNFWGTWSNTSGPNAPLIGGTYNITNTIVDEFGVVAENNPEKLILGVPYYGNKWTTQNNLAYSTVIDHLSQPRYWTAMYESEVYGLLWDDVSETSWSVNDDNIHIKQIWFDNNTSLGLKYDLAQMKSLKGVGMWALGYDGERIELWNELRKHFSDPLSSTKTSEDEMGINVFPNPFNSFVSVEFNLKFEANIKLNVFDSKGILVNDAFVEKHYKKGKHKIMLDMKNLLSGIYNCRINILQENKNIVVSRKLLKLN